MVVFVTGHHNTGKSTLADFLKQKGFIHIETGDIVRSVYKQESPGVEFSVWAQEVSGADPLFFDRCILKEIQRELERSGKDKRRVNLVVTGNRQYSGVVFLKERLLKNTEIRVVYLRALEQTLFERQLLRKDRVLPNLTADSFKDYLEYDKTMGVEDIEKHADLVVDANKEIEEIRAVVFDFLSESLEGEIKKEWQESGPLL